MATPRGPFAEAIDLPKSVAITPYGVDVWSMHAISVKHLDYGSIALAAPFPCVAIDKASNEPLRLNSEILRSPPALIGRQETNQLVLIMDLLEGFCRPWDKLALQFLDSYFEHIKRELLRHDQTISAKLAPFAGLYAASDWVFSAPKPLPRAHVYAPKRVESDQWDVDDFCQVDFAFWLGNRMMVALAQPGTLTPARANDRLHRLEKAEVAVVHFNATSLLKDPATLFSGIIGDFGELLDRAGSVPISPFRPQLREEL
jgi:hypothetical protein